MHGRPVARGTRACMQLHVYVYVHRSSTCLVHVRILSQGSFAFNVSGYAATTYKFKISSNSIANRVALCMKFEKNLKKMDVYKGFILCLMYLFSCSFYSSFSVGPPPGPQQQPQVPPQHGDVPPAPAEDPNISDAARRVLQRTLALTSSSFGAAPRHIPAAAPLPQAAMSEEEARAALAHLSSSLRRLHAQLSAMYRFAGNVVVTSRDRLADTPGTIRADAVADSGLLMTLPMVSWMIKVQRHSLSASCKTMKCIVERFILTYLKPFTSLHCRRWGSFSASRIGSPTGLGGSL